MHELVPHMSCVVTEQEFEEATQGNYQEVYVITGKGIFKHMKLKGGRHVRFLVESIPGYEVKDSLDEDIKFLPNGKIPYHLLEEIIQFFRDVMSIKKAEQEAMAHILWNAKDAESPDKGYRIGIPDQIVSKASANYTFNHIKQGDIIVVDIHSHNTMGAFFSGTDDTDDKKSRIYYAGVAGKLNERDPAMVWRLNINEHRKTVLVDNIFDIPQKQISIPKEWMDKVETKTYQPKGNGKNWQHPQGKGKGKGNGKGQQGGLRFDETDEERAMRFLESMRGGESLWEDLHSPGTGFEGVYASDRDIVDFNTVRSENASDSRRGIIVEEDERDTLAFGTDPSEEFDEHASNFGVETAEAYDQIVEWLDDLSDNDKLLLKVISRAYERMTGEGQTKLATAGI
jgi:PRTRC genetic system protein A